jgi:branched-chain amino acid transport system substrate-binding protein
MATASLVLATALSSAAHAEGGKEIKFAVTMPMTGIAAFQGEGARKAVALAFDEINGEDYFGDGTKLTASFFDTAARPDIGVRALQQAITTQGVQFVMTGYSSVTAAQAPVAARSKVVLVNVGAASPTLSAINPWEFNAIPLTHLQVPILLRDVIKTMGKKRIGLIYRDDDLGRGVKAVFEKSVKGLGGTLSAEESYLPGTSDFRGQLARLKISRPDTVYAASVATEIGTIIGQASSLGLRPLWMSYGAYEHKATWQLGGEASNGGVYSNISYYGADLKPTPEYARMVKAWKAKYGEKETVDYAEAQDYLGAFLFADVIKILKDQKKPITSDNMRDVMLHSHFKTIAGSMVFDKDHDAITNIALYRLEGKTGKVFKVYLPDDVLAINASVLDKH